MLSVKWAYDRGDHVHVEHVFEAERVTAAFDNHPATRLQIPLVDGREVHRGLVILDGPGLEGRSFDMGKVYVMNEQGNTVARYDLGYQTGTSGGAYVAPMAAVGAPGATSG